ncbi:transcription factor TFIIB [Nitrosopumilus sp. K4]|uniref:transcription initiation factor IIB n=1 Tax=Nitrosopumilus sp. K4 TaxID=2795383 RepID=UPI001BA46226|nr:transcription factor TFIIB [Nitrosopumilus sp. K4]QUC64089.1 transcription factor TFIIB [Nitrosopumilus sp. K4]
MNQILHKCNENKVVLITDEITGEIFCSSCGEVLRDKIEDRANESRIYTKEQYFSKSRTGTPSKISMFDMGNSSIINKQNIDSTGRFIPSKNKSHFSRLRLWDSRSKKNYKERNLVEAFTILDSITTKLNIPENTKEQSAYIYRKALEKKIIRGNSINSMLSASIYVSCKQSGIPRSIDEVAKAANLKRKTLSRTIRRIIQKLELDTTSTKLNYISKIANAVELSEKTARLSNRIFEDAKKEKIHVGKNPIGMSVASVYISALGCGENVSMAKLSKKNNISTVTIRKLVKLLRPFAAKYIETIEITK